MAEPEQHDLVTPRLRLHHFTMDEARRIADVAPGPEDRWGPEFPMQDDRDGVGGFLKAAADPTPFGTFRVDLDGVAVGTIGFYGPPDDDGQVTIGYGLVPSARRFGYATEAVSRIVEFCQAHEGVRTMLADTEKDNTASQRVLDKAGFAFVREDDELRYYRLDVSSRRRP